MYGIEWPANEWWYWTLCLLAQVGAMQWRVRSHPIRFPQLWNLGLWSVAVVGTGLTAGLLPTILTQSEMAGGFSYLPWQPLAWWVAGAMLLGLGIALLTRTLLGRRRAQHPRCVGCGYDMSGIPELRCPECGRAYRNASELLTARRRRRPIAMSVFALILGAASIGYPLCTYELAVRYAPTIVLLAFSDPMDYGDGWRELQNRRQNMRTADFRPAPLNWAERQVFLWKARRLLGDSSLKSDRDRLVDFLETFPPEDTFIPDFMRIASDPSEPRRGSWFNMLGNFAAHILDVERFLIGYVYEPDDYLARSVSSALGTLWEEHQHSEHLQPVPPDWLAAYAVAGSEKTRVVALRALLQYQPAITSIHAAMVSLAEPSAEIRSHAASLLLHADPHGLDSRNLLIHLLENDADIRDDALGIVRSNEGLLHDPRVRTAYADALLQTTPLESRYALRDLTELGTFPEWRIGVLVRALDAPALRDAALWRLAEIAPSAAAALPRLTTLEQELAEVDSATAARARSIIRMIEHNQPPRLDPP